MTKAIENLARKEGFEEVPRESVTYYLPTFTSSAPKGCAESKFAIGNVPIFAKEESYHLRLIVEYPINNLKNDYINIDTEQFEVGAGKILYLP